MRIISILFISMPSPIFICAFPSNYLRQPRPYLLESSLVSLLKTGKRIFFFVSCSQNPGFMFMVITVVQINREGEFS